MAITYTSKTGGQSSSGFTTLNTGDFTSALDNLVIIAITVNSASGPAVTSVGGIAIHEGSFLTSWVLAGVSRTEIWTARGKGIFDSVTMTFASAPGVVDYTVWDLSSAGQFLSVIQFQTATGSASTTAPVTLSKAVGGTGTGTECVYIATWPNNADNATAGTGWVERVDLGDNANREYWQTHATPSGAQSGVVSAIASTDYGGIIMEVGQYNDHTAWTYTTKLNAVATFPGATITTASVTTTAGSLHAFVIALNGSTPTSVNSITGACISGAYRLYSWGLDVNNNGEVWIATGTGAAGTIAITCATNPNAIGYQSVDVVSTLGQVAVVQSAQGNGLTSSTAPFAFATLSSSVAGGSECLFFGQWDDDTDAATPRLAWTELFDVDGGGVRNYVQRYSNPNPLGPAGGLASALNGGDLWRVVILEMAVSGFTGWGSPI